MIKVDPQSLSHLVLASNSPYIFTPPTQTIKSQWGFVIYTASPPYKDKAHYRIPQHKSSLA